MQQEDLGIVI